MIEIIKNSTCERSYDLFNYRVERIRSYD